MKISDLTKMILICSGLISGFSGIALADGNALYLENFDLLTADQPLVGQAPHWSSWNSRPTIGAVVIKSTPPYSSPNVLDLKNTLSTDTAVRYTFQSPIPLSQIGSVRFMFKAPAFSSSASGLAFGALGNAGKLWIFQAEISGDGNAMQISRKPNGFDDVQPFSSPLVPDTWYEVRATFALEGEKYNITWTITDPSSHQTLFNYSSPQFAGGNLDDLYLICFANNADVRNSGINDLWIDDLSVEPPSAKK